VAKARNIKDRFDMIPPVSIIMPVYNAEAFMKRIFFIYLSFFSLFLHGQTPEDSTLFFENAKIVQGHMSSYLNGWYITKSNFYLDSTVIYLGKKSLLLTPEISDPTQLIYACYYINFDDIDADSISFSCKYKYNTESDPNLSMGIQQLYINPTNNPNKTTTASKYATRALTDTAIWQNFSIKTAIAPNICGIFLYAYAYGSNMKVWLNNCKVTIDNRPLSNYVNVKYRAEEDHEFDKASGIQLPQATPTMIENLEILGKVWGFLKYYHPAVAKGNYNWDYELFRILPRFANAKDKTERNKLFNQWVDSYGKITETKDYSITDSTQYARFINLGWLNDKKTFDNELISKFNLIRNAKRNKVHYYIQTYQSSTDLNENREPKYPDISWEDQGFRLLTLFKFWNAMEYNSPFVETTHRPWNSLLKEYILRILEPKSEENYELTLRELFAGIDDSHLSYNSSSGLLPNQFSDYYFLPVRLTCTYDCKIVVKRSFVNDLAPGDIVLKIDGEDINSLIKKYTPRVSASNPSVGIYTILYWLFVSKKDKLTATFIHKGKEITKTFDMISSKDPTSYPAITKNYENEYKLASKNIAYIDMNVLQDDSIEDFIKRNNGSAKGIIIDMRNHLGQRFKVNSALNSWLIQCEKVYCWMAVNDKSYPGNFVCSDKITVGTNNPDYYKRKVVILVNENTMSVGEHRAMAYREATNSKIIGTPTSGAAGSFGRFNLPGAIDFEFTAQGLYYPYWGEYERTGVKIDIPVKQTVEDIRDGRDIWMEKAIEYLLNK